MDLPPQLFPQIVGHAARRRAGAAHRASGMAARGRDRLVHGQDDVGDAYVGGGAAEAIAAAGPAHAFHQPAAAQLGEKLFQIGQRNLLALGDVGQRNRLVGRLVLGQVGHGHDGVTAFGAQSHGNTPDRSMRLFLAFRGPLRVNRSGCKSGRKWVLTALHIDFPTPMVKNSARMAGRQFLSH